MRTRTGVAWSKKQSSCPVTPLSSRVMSLLHVQCHDVTNDTREARLDIDRQAS